MKQVDLSEAMVKAYAAGMLTRVGKLVVWGIGSNQGSWSRFTNIEFRGAWSRSTMASLRNFMVTHNCKACNWEGKTQRHRRFFLTHHKDEVMVLASYLGVECTLMDMVDMVDEWDEEHGLKEERKAKGGVGGIDNWQERTLKLEQPFEDLWEDILKTVSGRLMEDTGTTGQEWAYDLIANAFMEGTTCLTLGTQDLDDLVHGKTITEKYSTPKSKDHIPTTAYVPQAPVPMAAAPYQG